MDPAHLWPVTMSMVKPLTDSFLVFDKEFYAISLDSADEPDGNRLPSLDQIAALAGDVDTYLQICEVFLPDVVGVARWKLHYDKVPLREFVDVSDVALVVLLLENFYTRWKDYLKNKKIDQSIMTKFTSKKSTNGDGSPGKAANSKWSTAGLKRYNELVLQIKRERNSPTGQQFENTFLQKMKMKNAVPDDNDMVPHKRRKVREIVEIECDVVFAV